MCIDVGVHSIAYEEKVHGIGLIVALRVPVDIRLNLKIGSSHISHQTDEPYGHYTGCQELDAHNNPPTEWLLERLD